MIFITHCTSDLANEMGFVLEDVIITHRTGDLLIKKCHQDLMCKNTHRIGDLEICELRKLNILKLLTV